MVEKIIEGKPVKAISKELKIPLSTVYYKVKKLKEKGILKRVFKIDWKKLGFEIEAYILITTEGATLKRQREILKSIEGMLGFRYLDGRTVTGEADIIIHVVSKNMKELREILEKIKKIEKVKKTETLLVI